MRLTTVILIASLMQVSAAGLAQRVTLKEKNAVLKNVLNSLRKQTGYNVLYDENLINTATPVNLNLTNVALEDAVKEILKGQTLNFKIEERNIIIKPKTPSFLDKIKSAFADTDVRGRVVDDKGEPLAGASVKVKGTSKSATTNAKGEFVLQDVDERAILVISYIGYVPKEIAAGANLSEIKLELSNSKLDEVQVIAYGTTTQRYNVGSVTKITAEEIAQQPVGNVLQALAGRVPGLTVNQTTGLPGGAVKMQIRGQNSLRPTSGGNLPYDQPLFIIDGVPFSSNNSNINLESSLGAPMNAGNPYAGISAFNTIDPGMIESIEVLRDADATSIYGSRGTNGVILITTKKGVAGKIKVNANITMGQSRVTRTNDLMNTKEYVELRKESLKNDGITPNISNASDLVVFDTTKYTDWKKYFLGKTARTIDGHTSISGGSNNTQFLIGTGYHKETYIFPGDFSDNRISFNSNVRHRSTDQKLTVDLSLSYSHGKNNSASGVLALNAFTLLPNYPDLIDSQGNLVWSYKGIPLYANPLQYLKQKYTMLTYNLNSSFQLGYQFLPGIFIRANAGYNTLNSDETSLYPIAAQYPDPNITGGSYFSKSDSRAWSIEPQVEIKRYISGGELNAIIGGTFQKNSNNTTQIGASGYINDELLGSLSAAVTTQVNGASNLLYKYSALFGRINYIWDKKYILNLTGRRDGSSRFGPNKRFGNFGSIGAGWIFSEYTSIKQLLSILSYGKLRGSYGTTGSDATGGNYLYLDNWSSTSNTSLFQGKIGYVPSNLFNSDFSWALTKKMELGLDLSFFNDGLFIRTTWFRSRSGNQLVSYNLPIQTGFTSVIKNFPATVENKGWEFELTSSNIRQGTFSWSSTFNLTIPKNKLVAFPGIDESSYKNVYIVGQSLNVLNKFSYLNVDPTTGLFMFKSSKGATSTPTAITDYNIIGNTDPKFYGGLGNILTYKSIQLSFQLDFRKQLGVNYLQSIYSASAVGNGFNNQPAVLLNRWKNPGDVSDFQKSTSRRTASASNFTLSDGVYSDVSFIRLKTASLSYKLSNQYLKKANIQSVSIFLNAQNLFTLTNYKGNDPEITNFYAVPPLNTIVAGLQLNL